MKTNKTAQQLELNRIAIWPLTSKPVRAAVLMMAGLSRHRADDHLDSFTPLERAAIHTAAAMLELDASMIAKCASSLPVVH